MERFQHRGVTIVRRGRVWRWQVRMGGRRVSRSFDCLEAAIAGLDDVLRQRRKLSAQAQATTGPSITVGELCDRWFEWKRPLLAPATVQQYGIHIRVHIKPGIGDVDANSIRPRDFDTFYRTLRWKPAKESHNILRQAFSWGLLNEELARDGNPTLSVRPSRRSSTDHDGTYDDDKRIPPVKEKDIPTRKELDKLVIDAETVEDWVWFVYLKIAASTGARPGEVCGLQRKDIDLEKRTIRIEWTADRIGGKLKRPKTPSGVRTLRVSKRVLDSIEAHLPDDPEAYLFPSNVYPGGHSPLPCWNSKSVSRKLDAALERTGLPHYTPHGFRHYVATHLLNRRWQPLQVARYLGHSDDSEVRQRYANHIVDETQQQIADDAGDLI